jgi:lysozyme family protein
MYGLLTKRRNISWLLVKIGTVIGGGLGVIAVALAIADKRARTRGPRRSLSKSQLGAVRGVLFRAAGDWSVSSATWNPLDKLQKISRRTFVRHFEIASRLSRR